MSQFYLLFGPMFTCASQLKDRNVGEGCNRISSSVMPLVGGASSMHVKTTFDFAEQAALTLVQDCDSALATQAQVEEWAKEQQLPPLQEEKTILPLGIVM